MQIRKISIVLACIALLALSVPAFASKGSLNFYHGVRESEDKLLGGITSTANENSLGTLLYIFFDDGTDAVCGGTKLTFNQNRADVTYTATGYSGRFSCNYYCNGSRVGSSSAPWYFDF